jgi:predicted RNA-binding protein YlqC (UPF0109 family)
VTDADAELEGNLDDGNVDDDNLDDGNRVVGAVSRNVLDYLAKAIVEDPAAVMIEIEEGRRNSVSLRLHVSPDDMGRVIGRRGRVAQAIRTVVRAAGAGENVDAQVDIVD